MYYLFHSTAAADGEPITTQPGKASNSEPLAMPPPSATEQQPQSVAIPMPPPDTATEKTSLKSSDAPPSYTNWC